MVTEEATQQTETSRPARLRWVNWLRRGILSRPDPEGEDKPSSKTQWWEWAGYGGLLLTALIMRLWDLGSRAMHHDESLHAFYSWELFDGRGFAHNPMMHGPFQFEASAAVFFIFGDSDFSSRLVYALIGTVLVGLPFFFRQRLGKLSALFVSGLLAFSPAMLYFSRFARNDILMATWTLGLVISMWRYLDGGKNRYLYITAALLALAFATKETAYLVSAILGLYLFIQIAPEYWGRIRERIRVEEETPPPVAIGRIASGTWRYFSSELKLSDLGRQASFLFIIITLTLPQWSAAVSVLQYTPLFSWSNLTLANPEGVFPIGAPSGGGILIAALVVLILLGISVYWGFLWNWSVWWRSAAIFYSIWVLLYSTFFTNITGIGSGVWQGLGYWIAQQGVARGSQPWYYYFVITPLYEFLPLLFSIIAAVYYIRRKDRFGQFLVFWAALTIVMYTIASEKMPWLLVNVALPLIVISGKFLGDIAQSIEWRRLLLEGGLLTIIGVPALLFVLWQLAFFEAGGGAMSFLLLGGLAAVALGLVASGVFLARRIGPSSFAAFAAVPVAVILLTLTIRAGWIASYQNGDVPVEMIVYTQTSPDITRLMREIKQAGDETGQDLNVPITVDQTSGFTWPWAWYLRDYTRVDFPSYSGTPLEQTPDTLVLLVHSQNQNDAEPVLREAYTEAERIRHRWWFPESTYRDLTISKVFSGLVDRQAWRRAMDYFLYREGVRDNIGSEDGYVYFTPDFPQDFSTP